MHAFLACTWTCNVCPALYHEVEQHMDVKLNKDEQLLRITVCVCYVYAYAYLMPPRTGGC